MEGIYKYCEDFCYGYIEGLFIADSEDIDIITNAGLEIYLGEALGKYSDINVEFNSDSFELVTTDPEEIKAISKVCCIGYNPMDQEDFYFNNSDELNDAHKKVEDKWFSVEQFLQYIKDEGILETIKSGNYVITEKE